MNKRMLKKNLKKNKDKKRKKLKYRPERTEIVNTAIDFQSLKEARSRINGLDISKHPQIPANSEVLNEKEGWMFYLSRDNQAIYLRTTDYHSEPLRLTVENLNDLLTLIKSSDAR